MNRRKAFTLIELLAVVVILGLLVAVAYPAVNKYINDTKDTTYTLHEADMKTAASNMMSECIQNDTEDCVPKPGESKTIYLSELVDTKYSNPIKDPDKKDGFCKDDKSYVIVTNTGTSTVKLEYAVCLTCDKYASGKCSELEPGGTCDSTSDTTKPTCGDIVGSSTLWTNKDRVISVKCSDTGCGCTKGTFYKTFNETGKTGKITITDKAGRSEECEVNVYIDKDLPTCSLEVIGTKGENGWYGGDAPVIKFTSKDDVTSGVATYGFGLSKNNPEYNKLDSYTVTQGISTIFGYVKDNAGNVGVCSVEVQYDSIPATVDTVDYGSIVYPKADVASLDSNKRVITLDKTILDEYGEIFGVYFYQTATSTGMTATIKDGTTTLKTVTLSSGVTTPIRVLFDSPIIVSSNNLTIDLGGTNNANKISRIEIITRKDTVGYYTNQNVTLYINSHDSLSGKAYYTFDGVNYSDINYHTYTKNTNSVKIGLEDHAGNRNDLETVKITNIDKGYPSCTLKKSRSKDGNGVDWYKSSVDVLFDSTLDAPGTSDYAMSKVRDYSLNNPTGRGEPKSRTQDAATAGVTDTGYIIDNAGNVSSCTTVVKLDLTDPTAGTVTMTAGGSSIASGAEVNKDVTVTLKNGSDTGTVQSNHYTTKYTVVRDGTTVSNNITASQTYSAEGNYTITVTTYDQSGRYSTRSYTFMIDKTVPVCGTNDGSTTWINYSRKVTVQCSDPNGVAKSGCAQTSFNKTWSSTIKTSSITISDQAGNTATCNVNVYVDTTNPKCTTSNSWSSWTSSNRSLTVSCSDDDSKVSTCAGTSGTSSSKTYSTSTKTATYTVVDKAGNSATCSAGIYVDKTAPYCSSAVKTTTYDPLGVSGYWDCNDDHSGCASSRYYFTTVTAEHHLNAVKQISDNVGNTAWCGLTVNSTWQYRHKTCLVNASCEEAGCNTYSDWSKVAEEWPTCTAFGCCTEACNAYKGEYEWRAQIDQGTNPDTGKIQCVCSVYKRTCKAWKKSYSVCGCDTWSSGYTVWKGGKCPGTYPSNVCQNQLVYY